MSEITFLHGCLQIEDVTMATVFDAPIISSVLLHLKRRDTQRYFSLKTAEWRLSMLHISLVRKHREKGHYLNGPLDRSAVKHDSYMDTVWKLQIDSLSGSKRSTFNSRKDNSYQGIKRKRKGQKAGKTKIFTFWFTLIFQYLIFQNKAFLVKCALFN